MTMAIAIQRHSRHFLSPLGRTSRRNIQEQRKKQVHTIIRIQERSSSSFFQNLRHRVLNSLIATNDAVSSEQNEKEQQKEQQQENRSILLKELKEENEKERQDEYQKSMREAVAAARLEAAQKHEASMKQQKEKLERELEDSIRSRLEVELRLKERQQRIEQNHYEWQQQLLREEEEEQEKQRQQSHQIKQEEKEPQKEESQASTDIENAPESTITIPSDSLQEHPLLGKPIYDLGYKKIYSVSIDILANIPVWNKQRVYRHARAKDICRDKSSTLYLGLPGIICLYQDSKTGQVSILDGQHRIGAMAILQEKQQSQQDGNNEDLRMDLNSILVELYSSPDQESQTSMLSPKQSTNFAQDLFSEINKAEPVKLVDMPGIAKRSDLKIINDAADKLAQTYPEMFKPSQNCRKPHLNIDNLRDALFASNAIKTHGFKTSAALYDWMMEQNDVLGKELTLVDNDSKPMEKAKKFNFYLGMDPSWFYK